jgi:hypothetical protein
VRVFLTPKPTVLAIGYTEKIPPNQIKSAYLAVNWGKMLKNFHAITVRRVPRIWRAKGRELVGITIFARWGEIYSTQSTTSPRLTECGAVWPFERFKKEISDNVRDKDLAPISPLFLIQYLR